jgi:hypothetical protein
MQKPKLIYPDDFKWQVKVTFIGFDYLLERLNDNDAIVGQILLDNLNPITEKEIIDRLSDGDMEYLIGRAKLTKQIEELHSQYIGIIQDHMSEVRAWRLKNLT